MTHRDALWGSRRSAGAVLALTAASIGLLAGGCSDPAPPPVVKKQAPPPPPPPPPAQPSVKSIETLMAELGIDERIRMEESNAPATTDERIAALEFFDAFARADAATLRPMMQMLDQMELDALNESGELEAVSDNLYDVEVIAGTSPQGDKCLLAFYDVDGIIQPQLWHYFEDSSSFVFQAQPTPPNVMDQLSGTDLIAAWYALLEADLALADRDEVDVEWSPVDLDEQDGNSGGGYVPSGGGSSPGATPGGGQGRRRPTPPPRRPPGPPG